MYISIECWIIPSIRNLATYKVENIQQRKVNSPPPQQIKQGILTVVYINQV